MTTPGDITRLIHRVINSANIIETRLHHATTATLRNSADGYPTTASGNANQGGRSTPELQPTEAAAHHNLGDLHGYTDNTRDNPTGDDTHQAGYHPGPTTRYNDIADPLHAALKALDHAHDALNTAGVPPLITQSLQCRGINGQGCTDWADRNRDDHLCIDCGRNVDSNRRRLRRHKTA